MRLLDAQNSHPDATSFDQIIDRDGTILVCLHHWGDHGHPSLSNPEEGHPGKGLLLWFVVDDFDAAWERAQAMGSVVQEPPNTNNGTGCVRSLCVIPMATTWRSTNSAINRQKNQHNR
jgi:predicted enzyme related to lactoylglutathione lyase